MTNTTQTTSTDAPQATQGGGCRCGCGGHGKARRAQERADQAAATQTTAAEETTAEEAAAEATGAEESRDSGVVPGHKDGNSLGLRDVSAKPSGGCGCGSH